MALTIPQVGNFLFITLKGTVEPGTGENLDVITRPNVNGVAYRKIGKRSNPFVMSGIVDSLTEASAKDLVYDYKELQGTLVTIKDERGRTWTNVAVLGVRTVSIIPIKTSVGHLSVTNPTQLLTTQWTLQHTEFIET